MVTPVHAHALDLVVKPEVDSKQVDAERCARPADGVPGQLPAWSSTGAASALPGATSPGAVPPAPVKVKR
ncbi:MAG: hypothetical protein AW12_02468 [Candidatus Accumulibacter sp. BA-94]|nr:MAG: hypothetical protein AW12_02468 [Candidatus Accumulibacter sp. BA-94]